MRRPLLLALPVAVLLALGAVPVTQALAEGESAEIVVDVPPDFVRFGAELPLSGTVFGPDGQRVVRSPVSVATWNANLEEHTWAKTVTTDANGRFRTSVRATAATGKSVILAPALNGEEGDPEVMQASVPTVRLQYPVTLAVKKDPTDPDRIQVVGGSPECDEADFALEAAPPRGPFAAIATFSCTNAVLRGSADRPTAPGTHQYRLRRVADDVAVTSLSPVVAFR